MDSNENLIIEDSKVILMSSELKKKFKYLYQQITFLTQKINIDDEIKISEFKFIIEEALKKVGSHDLDKERSEKIKYDFTKIDSLYDEIQENYPDDSLERHYIKLINGLYEYHREVLKYYQCRDLIRAKNACLKNMKYFATHEEIDEFNLKYDEAIEKQDVDTMRAMLDEIEEKILEEWQNYFINLDNMTDDNFAFIGHSMRTSKFKGDFYTQFVSTSLFNQDLTDTYQGGFGFIFAPKNIIGANSSDMYVNNFATSQDVILSYSSIKNIDHPQRIIDECLQLKQQNLSENNPKPVYSEVIIDGFEPIGIFCFTNGAKSLDYEYRAALELQKTFPNLKVYIFDVMKRKSGVDLQDMKSDLLLGILRHFNDYSTTVNDYFIDRYEYFFNKFELLKQGEYTEEDIINLYLENKKLVGLLDENNIFSGEFSDEQIKYILCKGYKFNINIILGGATNTWFINNLANLYSFKDRLDYYIDGLSDLVEVMHDFRVTDELMGEINSHAPLTIQVITDVIKQYKINLVTDKINDINAKIDDVNSDISQYKRKYDVLLQEYNSRLEMQDRHDKLEKYYHNNYWVQFIKEDYQKLMLEISSLDKEGISCKKELELIVEKIKQLTQDRDKAINENIDDEDYEKNLAELSNMLNEAMKHPLINKSKIQKLRNQIDDLNFEHDSKKREFEFEQSKKIRNIEYSLNDLISKKEYLLSDFERLRSRRKDLQSQYENIFKKIREYYDCDTIFEMEEIVREAETFMANYDGLNNSAILKIRYELEEIKKYLREKNVELEEYNQSLQEKNMELENLQIVGESSSRK